MRYVYFFNANICNLILSKTYKDMSAFYPLEKNGKQWNIINLWKKEEEWPGFFQEANVYTTICVQPQSVNIFLCMFIFQTRQFPRQMCRLE